MKSYSSREIIALLRKNGYRHVRTTGDHYHYRHPDKSGLVTVRHPVKDLGMNDLKSIEKQSGIAL